MTCEIVEKLGPFGANPGIGHIAGEHNVIQRLARVDRIELPEQPLEALIAARAQPPALETEAVALADHMNVGQMHDAPPPSTTRGRLKRDERVRLVHRGDGTT